ncbi:MAG: hypothetical protein JNL73_22185 [Anaerolineales bacterium]|nr:hypothetical protein [Anaerolineales bacterium]
MIPRRRRARAPSGPRLADPALVLAEERSARPLPLFDAATLVAIASAARQTCATCDANPFERCHPQRSNPALALLANRAQRVLTPDTPPDMALRWSALREAARDTCAECPLERVRETCGACPLVAFLSTLATDG